jgi:hypothetical protein
MRPPQRPLHHQLLRPGISTTLEGWRVACVDARESGASSHHWASATGQAGERSYRGLKRKPLPALSGRAEPIELRGHYLFNFSSSRIGATFFQKIAEGNPGIAPTGKTAHGFRFAQPGLRLFHAVDSDDVKFRVFLADLECSLKVGRIVPSLQRLHAVPAEDHNWPAR